MLFSLKSLGLYTSMWNECFLTRYLLEVNFHIMRYFNFFSCSLKAIGLHTCELIIHLRNINLENWIFPLNQYNILQVIAIIFDGANFMVQRFKDRLQHGVHFVSFGLTPTWPIGEVCWLSKSKSILQCVGEIWGDRYIWSYWLPLLRWALLCSMCLALAWTMCGTK